MGLSRGSSKRFLGCVFLSFATLHAGSIWNGPENQENFRIEVTGSAWLVHSAGTIQANGAPVDLISDLGAEQRKPAFYGRLVLKPSRKQRIVVEGSPISINGLNTVARSIVYRGQTFNVRETVRSSADLNYFFAGYQYDFLSGPAGHLGLSAGGAYIGATGIISALQSGTTASKTQSLGLPLAGAEFRLFPIRRHRIFEVEGGLRGMAFGSYGHFVEGSASGGVRLGPMGILAGYRELFADLHQTGDNTSGVNVRLKGPVFSVLWRW
jgi:hypothetical protein